MFQPLREPRRIGRQRMRRPQMDRAVGAALDDDLARTEAHRSHRR
jgi:hypothetical protein